ncbi:L-rhamnose/proton symporter RhaT [Spirosoma areae]
MSTTSGQVIVLGLAVCMLEISICGIAGMMKERTLTDEQKKETIAEFDIRNGFYMNNAALVIILLGGLTTNAIWTIYLNIRNRTYSDYANISTPILTNIIFCALAGFTWYFQFFFYALSTVVVDFGNYLAA